MPSEHYTKSFYEGLRSGAARSAQAIVPLVFGLLRPRSVVDVGCGDGTWLAVFRKLGTPEILGIDGDYVERSILEIPPESFQAVDLTKPFSLGRIFDFAVSLEVGEHLTAASAPGFVESLTRLAPAVLFSAAIPFQGGNHHVNEQWPDKWAALFGDHGYLPVDCIRKHVWHNDAVDWWYAQNTLLFARKDVLEANSALKAEFEQTNLGQLRLVHPRNYLEALTPVQSPPWDSNAAWELFLTCFRNALKRRLYAVLKKQTPPRNIENPPNFNSVLENSPYCAFSRRQGQA